MISPKTIAPFTNKVLAAVLLIPLLVSGCGADEGESKAPKAQAIPVKLQTLETSTLINSSEYVGTLEAKGRVDLAPRIDGRIVKIFVQPGDRVQQGEAIVRLEPTQQQEDVNAATQNVNVERARLAQVQAELKTAEAEQARTAADVERVRADIKDQEAELKLAQINIKRSKFLVESGVQPQQDLDDKTRDLESRLARLDAGKESLNSSLKALEAAKRRVDQALANVDSQNASVGRAKAQLGSIGQNLAFNTIQAPINGIVGSFQEKKVGDFIRIGEPITTITDNQAFYLNVGIPTEYRSRLKLGLPVEIVNEDGSPGIRGAISYIAPLVDPNTQSILTKFSFPNDDSLRDRQYVRVRVIWDTRPGLLVSTIAVSTVGGQKFVFVAKQEETPEGNKVLSAKQTPIQVGTIQGQSYQIISGVKPGDKIAVNRILDLKDGTSITEESIKDKKTISK
jgi:RND family efflux transporter MFP subunit